MEPFLTTYGHFTFYEEEILALVFFNFQLFFAVASNPVPLSCSNLLQELRVQSPWVVLIRQVILSPAYWYLSRFTPQEWLRKEIQETRFKYFPKELTRWERAHTSRRKKWWNFTKKFRKKFKIYWEIKNVKLWGRETRVFSIYHSVFSLFLSFGTTEYITRELKQNSANWLFLYVSSAICA